MPAPSPPAAGPTLLGAALLGSVLVGVVLVAGCREESSRRERRGPANQAGAGAGLFESVTESLDQLEQFETDQMLKQIGDRLNQWYLQEQPKTSWQADPLLEGLSDELRNQPDVRTLGSVRFQSPDDGWFSARGRLAARHFR